MTGPFTDAAELMARVLGAEGYAFAVIDHPISSAGPEQLVELARSAAVQAAELLTGRNGAG